jgi:hypothetical protein
MWSGTMVPNIKGWSAPFDAGHQGIELLKTDVWRYDEERLTYEQGCTCC